MNTRRLWATLLLAALLAAPLAACSREDSSATQPARPAKPAPAQPPRPIADPAPLPSLSPPPAPTPHAAVSELRADGNLGERHTRIVAEASQGGHEIAFIGDSITEGWAGAGKDAWKNIWAPRHAVNCGIGGDRTQHVLGRLDNGLLDALAAPNNNIKWVVLMIGTNNTGTDSAEDITAGIHAILHTLHHHLPHAQIALFAVFPRGQFPNPGRDTINSINTRLADFAAHVPNTPPVLHYIDIGPKFLRPGGELPADLMPDFLHLSPAGYKIWSDDLANVIK